MRETKAIIVEIRFGIEILRREAVAEEVGERARLGDDVAEGVVGVLRDGVAAGIEVASDVAVVVVAWNVELLSGGVGSGGVGSGGVGDCKVKQPADATCALETAGEVFAPIVTNGRCCAVRVGNALLYEVPVVVEESSRCFGRHLLHAAGFRVVEVREDLNAVRGNGLQPIGGIVGERQDADGKHVAVDVVCGHNGTRRRVGDNAPYHRVLV